MRTLIRTPDRIVAVEGDTIVEANGSFDVELDFPRGHVRPGLINAHDHLHRNHYGRLGVPPYRSAYDWARHIQQRHTALIAERHAIPRRDALLAGAWKNLFAGVTTVIHHDRWELDFECGFPIRVASVAGTDSLGMTPNFTPPGECDCFSLHLAEGTDVGAAEEGRTLHRMGLLSSRLIAVHGVGLDADGVALFRRSGAALVWCPSSNLFLLGRTAPPELLAEGLDLLVGSDSLLSADGNLLDELRCARRLGLVSDERLQAAVGTTAAKRLGLALPSLEPGAPADILVLVKPLLDACSEDVEFVMVNGIPRVARADFAPALSTIPIAGQVRRVGGVTRWTSVIAGEAEIDFAAALRSSEFQLPGEPRS
jgi:cytosine/adenosine deaminase-related metal-dependent hydrolase